jgi:hypothetical protein
MIRVDAVALNRSALRLRQAAGRALEGLALEAAEHLAKEAGVRTPVDTGRLRAGWRARETGVLSAVAENAVPYASFVEFDTRHWISGNIVPGQRFLGRAMAETESALPGMAKARLREVIEGCFGD